MLGPFGTAGAAWRSMGRFNLGCPTVYKYSVDSRLKKKPCSKKLRIAYFVKINQSFFKKLICLLTFKIRFLCKKIKAKTNKKKFEAQKKFFASFFN